MNKFSLIIKYFQKKDQLTTKNKDYCTTCSSLFQWLVENDKADSDMTTRLLGLKSRVTAKIISRQEGVIAGLEEVLYLVKTHTSLHFKPLTTDGKTIRSGQTIVKLKGNALEVLAYERAILNILQRMSGIATETNYLIKSLKTTPGVVLRLRHTPGVKEPEIPHPFIAATRKTPWMGLDKKAVSLGGGLTHRLNLADGILIKDNHLVVLKEEYGLKAIEEAIVKSLENATKTPRGWLAYKSLRISLGGSTSKEVEPQQKKELIEIEVETPNRANLAIQTWTKLQTENPASAGFRKRRDRQPPTDNRLAIMFDNFSPHQVKIILSDLSDLERNQVIFEASGSINESNIRQWAKTGVDIISIGSLTHSVKAINLSLEIYS